MKLHHTLVTIMILSMLVLGSTTWLGALGTGYSKSMNTNNLNNSLLPILEEYNNKTQELSDTVNAMTLTKDDVSDYTLPYTMIKTGWQIGKVFFGAWSVLTQIIRVLSTELAAVGIILPGWFIGTIASLIIISLLAIIVYAFFKWKMED